MTNLPYHTAKAVLLYRTTGQSEEYYGASSGVCGPGTYAVLFDGDPIDAENAAREYLHLVKCTGYKIQEWKIFCNVEGG